MPTSLTAVLTPWGVDVGDGRWVQRTVRPRVDLQLDGRSLSTWLPASAHEDFLGMVTPLDVTDSGVEVLEGRARYEDWQEHDGRVPVMVCACGDLLCGALTVRLTRADTTVTWSQWAWENYSQPAELMGDVPDATFDSADYSDALAAARRLAWSSPAPFSVMRVRRPGPWWRNLRTVPEERRDDRTMLAWLFAEPVRPGRESDGTYADMVDALDEAQAAFAARGTGVEGRRLARPALERLVSSPHALSLPSMTLEAARWFMAESPR